MQKLYTTPGVVIQILQLGARIYNFEKKNNQDCSDTGTLALHWRVRHPATDIEPTFSSWRRTKLRAPTTKTAILLRHSMNYMMKGKERIYPGGKALGDEDDS